MTNVMRWVHNRQNRQENIWVLVIAIIFFPGAWKIILLKAVELCILSLLLPREKFVVVRVCFKVSHSEVTLRLHMVRVCVWLWVSECVTELPPGCPHPLTVWCQDLTFAVCRSLFSAKRPNPTSTITKSIPSKMTHIRIHAHTQTEKLPVNGNHPKDGKILSEQRQLDPAEEEDIVCTDLLCVFIHPAETSMVITYSLSVFMGASSFVSVCSLSENKMSSLCNLFWKSCCKRISC